MKTTTIVTILSLGALAAFGTGCGPSKALQATQAYETAVCACKDTACTTTASKAYADASKDMGTATSGEADAFAKSTTNAAACITKLAMASVPAMPAMPAMPKP